MVHVQDHPELYADPPQDGLSYCFSHFMGIFCTASLIFLVYSIAKWVRALTEEGWELGVGIRMVTL